MAITPLPPAPQVTDDTATFNTKAFAWVDSIDTFTTEANALAVQANTDANTATVQAGIATTKAGEASASADLAEDWATKTDGEVAGGEFSAKKYAQDSSDSADAAAASAVEAAGLVENYQGALASDPTLNKDGDPLQAGDWYVNTSTGLIRAYTGSVWVTSVNVTAGVSGFSAGTTGLTPSTNTQGEIVLGGTLGVANGGTGLTSPGTVGNVLTSDGTGWTSSAIAVPPSLPVGALQYFAGATTTTYPGDEWLLCDGSVLTQTAYSDLFNTLGLIGDAVSTRTNRSSGTTSSINALIYGNGIYVYAGAGGVLATSTDAVTWTARTSGTASAIFALTYGNGIYVFAGAGGILRTSTDAITWTTRTSGTTTAINALTYGNGIFVYGANNGELATSTNGITWIVRSSGTTSSIDALIYGNGIYVYAGVGGVLATSTDAITWTARTSGSASGINALVYGNSTFVYGTTQDNWGFSSDGISWLTRSSPTTSNINALTYFDNIFVFAGAGGILRTSNEYTYDSNVEFVLPAREVITSNGQNNLFIKAE